MTKLSKILSLLALTTVFSTCASKPPRLSQLFGFTPIYEEGSPKSYFEKPNILVAVFPSGQYGPDKTGYNFNARVIPSLKKTISYEVKFDEDFNFVKGGKLPGLCGGKKATGGNKADGYNGFSARIMWRVGGEVVSYVYHVDQKTRFGDDFNWLDAAKQPLAFTPGQWHKIKMIVKLNDIEKTNGSIQAYLDGDLVFEKNDFNFRLTDKIQIDTLCFNTFFGGDDISWAPQKEEKLSIRGLTVTN